MATQVQLRRGNTTQTGAFTGAVAEITVDTTKNTIVVHDGSTVGGFALARESALSANASFSQAAFTQANAAFLQANTPSYTSNSAASYANAAFSLANTASSTGTSAGAYANSAFAAANAATATDATQNTNITSAATYANSAFATANNEAGVNVTQNTNIINVGTYANAAFLVANTPSYTSNSAASYANSAFAVANNESGVNTTQNTNITNVGTYANSAFLIANTPSHVANSAASYANSGFSLANTANITANSAQLYANSAFTAANTPSATANSASSYANSAFLVANTPTHVANSAASYANGAFTRANNSVNANTGGTITGDISITGNLTVTGLTTYTNTSTVLVADNIITVNAAINQSSEPAVNAGIEVDRGAQPNTSFLWIESSGKWAANNGNGSIFIAADSAESYANGAFASANLINGVDLTQNTNITNAGTYANSAFLNANSAFIRANNSLNANTGGTVAGSIVVDGGTYGNVTINQFASVWGQAYGANPYSIMQVRSNDFATGMGMQTYVGLNGLLYSNTGIQFTTGANVRDKDYATGGTNAGQFAANGAFIAQASLASTSNSTGSIQVVGGVGVKGNVYADAIYDGDIEIIAYANTIFLAANTPSHVANSAASYANAAFSTANSAFAEADSAASYANSAFGVANTDVTNINITTGTFGNSAYYPVITVSANGRINVVTTQVVTDPSAIAFAIALG